MRSYLVVGDVHGCVEEFAHLVTVGEAIAGDKVIIFSVGDLLDKAPQGDAYKRLLKSCMTLEREGRFKMVIGNHEDRHLKFEKRETSKQKNRMEPKKKPHLFSDFWDTRRQLLEFREETGVCPFSWIGKFPYFEYLAEHHSYIIHGGLSDGKMPEEMAEDKICRVRQLDSITGQMIPLSKVATHPRSVDWTKKYTGDARIFYGHDAGRGARYDGKTIGLDGGCVYGDRLHGYLLPQEVEISVPARMAYAERREE